MTTAAASRSHRVFVSDVHLGSRHCHAAATFLEGLRCGRLYLVCDIIERFVQAGLDDARRQGLDGIIRAPSQLSRAA